MDDNIRICIFDVVTHNVLQFLDCVGSWAFAALRNTILSAAEVESLQIRNVGPSLQVWQRFAVNQLVAVCMRGAEIASRDQDAMVQLVDIRKVRICDGSVC